MTAARKPAAKPTFYGVVVNGEDIFIAPARATEAGARALAAKTGDVAGVVEAGGVVEARDKAAAFIKAAARKATAAKARAVAAPKALFYAVGTDEAGAPVADKVGFKRGDWALDASASNLPTASDVAAIQAGSPAEALAAYVALDGNLPKNGIVKAAAKAASGSKPRQPAAPKTKVVGYTPVEAADGNYLVSKTGMLHSSDTCHFVAGKADAFKALSGADVAAQAHAAWHSGEAVTIGDVKVRYACLYCASEKVYEAAADVIAAAEAVVAAAAQEAEVNA